MQTETVTLKGATNIELTYTRQGDYLIPDLTVPESPRIGKYGMLRRSYLMNHRSSLYTGLLLSGKLNRHLEEIDRQATEMVENMVARMAQTEGVTEQLKAQDQMKWVGLMNNIRSSAEETVLRDLIYS